MKRLIFLLLLSLPGLLSAASKPNILVFLVDDMGLMDTSVGEIMKHLESLGVGTEWQGMIDGANLAPALQGGSLDREAEFLMHFPHSHRSSYYTVYRLGDWKLIYHYTKPEAERYELFHLAEDPAEAENLAKAQPADLTRMVAAMSKALEEAGAQYPVAKDNPDKELKPIVP